MLILENKKTYINNVGLNPLKIYCISIWLTGTTGGKLFVTIFTIIK